MRTTPTSGDRDDAAPTATPPTSEAPASPAPAAPHTPVVTPPPAPVPAVERRAWWRDESRRPVLAGLLAAILALAIGGASFAVGYAVGDDGDQRRWADHGPDGRADRGMPGPWGDDDAVMPDRRGPGRPGQDDS